MTRRNSSIFTFMIFAILICLTSSAQAAMSFSLPVNYETGRFPYGITSADFNGDGNLDLAVTSSYSIISPPSHTIYIFLGNGDGTFDPRVDYETGNEPYAISSGDFNKDGKMDLATSNNWDRTISILLGGGDGTFTTPVNYETAYYPTGINSADFNGDGFLDLAVSTNNNYDDFVSIFLGNGDGTFDSPVNYESGWVPRTVSIGDFNGDGNLDLATPNYYDHTISILTGRGDGTFNARVDYATGSYPVTAIIGDFNTDSILDIVVPNVFDQTISILTGRGDGTFNARVPYYSGIGDNIQGAGTGDFNLDGKPDIVTVNGVPPGIDGSVNVIQGNADGTFASIENLKVGNQPMRVISGDFNGDAKPDLAVSNWGGNSVPSLSILLNTYNRPPIANLEDLFSGLEGSAITFDASKSIDPDGDLLQYRWDFDNDGVWDNDWSSSSTVTKTWNDDFSGTVKVEVSDGKLTATDTATVTVNNVAPIIDTPTADKYLAQVGTIITGTGIFHDPGTLDTFSALWNWEESTKPLNLPEGSTSTIDNHIYASPGVYSVGLTIIDKDGGSDSESMPQFIVIYDPSAGFVTGGGWINSPAGAYVADPLMIGKANFGFVSKYQKGATKPTGQTEFQFKAGNMNFHSTEYEWLVVAGSKAMYKGSGTINGEGNYGFMLSAIDGQVKDGGGTDKFRIKIWNTETNTVVYDNQIKDPEDTDPTTALGGGSIVIQK